MSAGLDPATARRARRDGEPAPLLEALDQLRDHAFADAGGEGGEGGEDALPFELWQRALFDPAEELLGRPGKGFRGKLTELAWRGAGAAGPVPPALPWVVELLHAGSLIVDDVQDDSSHRRGGPALHRMIGAPLAINTGNWMYFGALSLLGGLPLPAPLRAALTRDAITALMRCHQGQALDLSLHVTRLLPRQLPAAVAATTRHKTGVLMSLAARLGAAASGAELARVAAIARFGEELGVGLQMLDDLGGIAAPGRRDKGLEDLCAGRPTWPWAWLAGKGDDASLRAVTRLQQRLRAGERDAVLLALRDATSDPGRAAVRAQLQRCLRDVAAHLEAAVHRELAAELARLEASYG